MNTKLKEAMEYMDPKYIDEAVEYKANKRSYKPLVRWGAIAACLVLIVSLSFGLFGGSPVETQPTEPQKEIVLPPCREGKRNNGQALLNGPSTFEEAVEASSVVAWVRVGNWLSEDLEAHPLGVTYYEVEVIEAYKGDLPETFVFRQYGSSYATMKEFPLLTYGDELLVFLNLSELQSPYGACYYLTGNYATLMHIEKDANGVPYASPKIPPLGYSLEAVVENLAKNSQLKDTLGAAAASYDTLLTEEFSYTEHLFKLSEIVDLMNK